MAWIARDKNERLYIYSSRPERKSDEWEVYWADAVELPSDADDTLNIAPVAPAKNPYIIGSAKN